MSARLSEIAYRISRLLFDGPKQILELHPLIVPVQDINPSRFMALVKSGSGAEAAIYLSPPEEKVWRIKAMRAFLTTDANIAARQLRFMHQVWDPITGTMQTCKDFVLATVAASSTYIVEMGLAATADPTPAPNSLLATDEIVLYGPKEGQAGASGSRLWFWINANGQVGDALKMILSIEETNNYGV